MDQESRERIAALVKQTIEAQDAGPDLEAEIGDEEPSTTRVMFAKANAARGDDRADAAKDAAKSYLDRRRRKLRDKRSA